MDKVTLDQQAENIFQQHRQRMMDLFDKTSVILGAMQGLENYPQIASALAELETYGWRITEAVRRYLDARENTKQLVLEYPETIAYLMPLDGVMTKVMEAMQTMDKGNFPIIAGQCLDSLLDDTETGRKGFVTQLRELYQEIEHNIKRLGGREVEEQIVHDFVFGDYKPIAVGDRVLWVVDGATEEQFFEIESGWNRIYEKASVEGGCSLYKLKGWSVVYPFRVQMSHDHFGGLYLEFYSEFKKRRWVPIIHPAVVQRYTISDLNFEMEARRFMHLITSVYEELQIIQETEDALGDVY